MSMPPTDPLHRDFAPPRRIPRSKYDTNFGMDFGIPGRSHGGRASAHDSMDFGIPGSSHGGRASHRNDPRSMRATETAVAYPLSPAGKQIHCIVDTGASMTSVKRSMLRRHFPRIAVKRDIGINMSGISGGSEKTNERVMLPLTFVGARGERIQTVGEVWLTDGRYLDTEILLGLPYLRDNGMHLQWGGGVGHRAGGDYISCRGVKIPIKIDARQ